VSPTDPRDRVTSFIVRPAKLSRYLLDVDHIHGRAKAAFFIRHGFSVAAPADLGHALCQHGRDGSLAGVRRDAFGLIFEVDGGVLTPRNRVMRIRSVWSVQDGREHLADFVTAFPQRG
jgi:hypothetical protein